MCVYPQFGELKRPEPLQEGFLRSVVRLALRRLAEQRPDLYPHTDADVWIQRASRVLVANIASGRIETAYQFQSASEAETGLLLCYAEQVLVEMLSEWDRIAALCTGDSKTWHSVIRRLVRLAYHRLGPQGRESWAVWEARDLAARTCADMWAWLQKHSYPFDIPFERWSAAVLNNRLYQDVRNLKRDQSRVSIAFDELQEESAQPDSIAVQFVDQGIDEWLEQVANREALTQALSELNERYALVLKLWYLEQWSGDEIAAEIGTTVGNVYVLRFRALDKLRQIVLRNERLGLARALSLLESETQRSRPGPDFGDMTS